MKSPIQYFGGKARLARRIVDMMLEHKIYVEPFGGAMNVLLAKDPSKFEVYNDLDSEIVNFFKVLQNPNTLCDFINRAWVSPFSREESYRCKELIKATDDPIEKAKVFLFCPGTAFRVSRKA